MVSPARLFALRGSVLSRAGGGASNAAQAFNSVSRSRALNGLVYRSCYSSLSSSSRMMYSTTSTPSENSSTSSAETKNGENNSKKSDDEVSKTDEKDKLIAEKDKEIANLKDGLLRSMADFQNLQKITEREKQQSKEFAIRSFASDLVSSLDVLQLALNSVAAEKRTDKSNASTATAADLVDLYTGVEMTQKEIEKTLNRHGVEQFNPVGEKFDPNRHEALYQAPVPGKDHETVIECMKAGWVIKDRLLRAAQVGVAINPESS